MIEPFRYAICSYNRSTDFLSMQFRARHRRRWRECRRPRGTTDPRPSCKTSERHPFWRLQDTRRVPPVARARNRNERNTIVEPPITPIAGRVTTPTGDSLTTYSLFTDTLAASAAAYVFVRAREREENERFPRPETLSRLLFNSTPPRATLFLVGRWTINRSYSLVDSRARARASIKIFESSPTDP